MAFLEQRGDHYRVIFRYAGRRYTHTLNTTNPTIAQGLVGGIEKTLMVLDQKLLTIPDGVAVLPFVVGNGQVEPSQAKDGEAEVGQRCKDITLGELRDGYIQTHSAGAIARHAFTYR